jgi:hypothetical protein
MGGAPQVAMRVASQIWQVVFASQTLQVFCLALRKKAQYVVMLQDKVANPEKIDVLEAMHIAVAAWSMDVKLETICNCFRHCQIRTTDADVTSVPKKPLIDREVIKDLEEQVQELRYQNPMDIRNLIDYPAEREVAYVPTQEEIV